MKTNCYTALACAAFLSACGSNGGSDAASNQAIVGMVAEPSPVALGAAGEGPGVTVTINSVKEQQSIGAEGFGPKTEPGETFVVVRYTIKNTSTKPLSSTDRPDLALIDGAGRSYSEDTQAGILEAALNNDIHNSSGDLNPNVSAKATAVWKIDKASFDRKKWRVRATLGGFGAALEKAASWPREAKTPPPLTFSLE
jgi:hypothetical protein